MHKHETPGHLWITWDQYHGAIENLASRVYESGWAFDQVVCIARGGLRVGDVFSRLFKCPLAILSASSYREAAGTQRGELDIAQHISSSAGPVAGRVLLVDDLVDSGITLERVQTHLSTQFPAVTEVRSAVIWYKACSAMKPDYYLEYLADSPWIHQPFELYDEMSPQALVGKNK